MDGPPEVLEGGTPLLAPTSSAHDYYYYYYYYYYRLRPLDCVRDSGTTQVSRYQKCKTNLDLLEQETVSGSVIS